MSEQTEAREEREECMVYYPSSFPNTTWIWKLHRPGSQTMFLQEEPDTEPESVHDSAIREPSMIVTGMTSVPVSSHTQPPYGPSEPSVHESSSGTHLPTQQHPRSGSVSSMLSTPSPSSTPSSSTTVWTSPLTISSDKSSDLLRTPTWPAHAPGTHRRALSQPLWRQAQRMRTQRGVPEGRRARLRRCQSNLPTRRPPKTQLGRHRNWVLMPSASIGLNRGHQVFLLQTADTTRTSLSMHQQPTLSRPLACTLIHAPTTRRALQPLLTASPLFSTSQAFAEPIPSLACEFCSFADPLHVAPEGQSESESGRIRFVALPPEARRWFLLLERAIERGTIERDEVRCRRCPQKMERDFPYLPRVWLVHKRTSCPAGDELGSRLLRRASHHATPSNR